MMLAMDGLEAAQREMRIDLRGGDVGMAQQQLHRTKIGAVLDHVRGTTVAQGMRTGCAVAGLDQNPHRLASERHASQREKELCAVGGTGSRSDPGQMGAALFEIGAESFESGNAEGDDTLFVTLAADKNSAQIEGQVAGGQARDFRD